jgi:prepilin-type processing-associated H-X9-DG protein
MILFRCECGRELQARDEDAGRKSKCPACGLISVIPPPEAIVGEQGSIARAERTRPDAVQADEPDREREREGERRRRPDAVRSDERGRRRSRDRYRDDEDDRPPRDEEPEGTSTKSTVALVLGLLSFPCGANIFTGVPAIIFGAIALRDIGKSRGRLGGKGMAIAGMITGGLGIFILLPVVLLALLLPAVQKVREAAGMAQDANNLKMMAIAMHNIHSTHGAFPRAAPYRSPDGKPLLSWRVALLPYLEQDMLYKRFRLDEPWDSPNNKPLLSMIPPMYLQPGETNDGSGMTYYQVFVGRGTVFDDSNLPKKPPQILGLPNVDRPPERGLRVADITDGTSNTILITVGRNPVPWTKPEDLPFDPNGPLPPLGGPSSPQRFNVVFADGSVRRIDRNTSPSVLKAMITRNGGEVVPPP